MELVTLKPRLEDGAEEVSHGSLFDFKLASGSPEGILDEPYGMVLTRETARKFFGDADPVGKFLEVDTLGSYEVMGVLEETRQ